MAKISKRTWVGPNDKVLEAFRVTWRDAAGVKRTKQFDRMKGEDGAEKYKQKIERDLADGVHTADGASITVAKACAQWVEKATRRNREASTTKGYEETARLHIIPLLGTKKLSQLTRPMVNKFRDDLLDSGRSIPTTKKAVRALSMLLTKAMDDGKVAQNVARGVTVDGNERDNDKVKPPTVEVVKAMLAAAKEMDNSFPDVYPIILLTAATGMRSSEVRALRWIDLDLKGGWLEVCQSTDLHNLPTRCKSRAAYRTIPLDPNVVAELKAWKLRCPTGKDENGNERNPGGLVFPNRHGMPIAVSHLREQRWLPVLKKIGAAALTGRVEKDGTKIYDLEYGMHDLRHFAASRWIAEKVDPKRLVSWLGHADFAFTVRIYGHLMKDEQRDQQMAAAATGVLFT